MQLSHHADKSGPLKGVAYDGEDPANQDLYFDKHDHDNFRSPLNPPESWRELWKARMKDLIDNYHPYLLYFNGACPFLGDDNGQSGMEIIAHLYNDNLEQTGGESNGVHFIKKITDHGIFIPSICLVDYEGHAQSDLDPVPWQTDVSIGDWFYRKPDIYKSVSKIIHLLIDIVSKNGNMLLNIPPRPDGSLDSREIRILQGVGKWMKSHGEAIYETRPWIKPSEKDLRFMLKGDILYLAKLKKPFTKVVVQSLGKNVFDKKIEQITDLDSGKFLKFSQSQDKLVINIPLLTTFSHAKILKITFHSTL